MVVRRRLSQVYRGQFAGQRAPERPEGYDLGASIFLVQSNFVDELEMLDATKPLINTETVWKPHALLLLGDYFTSKKEYLKAKEFYIQILSLKNLHKELYRQAESQLILITNE